MACGISSFGNKVKKAAKKEFETYVFGNMLECVGSAQKVEMDAVGPQIWV
jgi:hypothetical protein